jgi:hypothetical protein
MRKINKKNEARASAVHAKGLCSYYRAMLSAFSIVERFPCLQVSVAEVDRAPSKKNIFVCIAFFFFAIVISPAQSLPDSLCMQLQIQGEATQGAEWHVDLGHDSAGQQWLIRLVPLGNSQISAGNSFSGPFSGWTLAVNPASDQNYPDALLLATPPYGSLNASQIATTYGLRAQDAIAWSPRHFHFFTSVADLSRARQLYRTLLNPKSAPATRQQASAQLLDLISNNSTQDPEHTASGKLASGQIEILDAHLLAGTADPPPFAAQWAAALVRIPHTLDQNAASSTPAGALHSIRFRLTLWLPSSWKPAPSAGITRVKCAE